MPWFIPNNVTQTTPSGNQSIDGLLWGWHWADTNWGYAFPTSTQGYLDPGPNTQQGQYFGAAYEAISGFQSFNALQQSQIVQAVDVIETFLPVSFKANATLGQDAPVVFTFALATEIDQGFGSNAIGEPFSPRTPGGGSAEAVPPDPFQTNWRAGGDNWFNPQGGYQVPIPGSFANAAGLLHEFGHSLGLKHGHEFFLQNGQYSAQPVYNMTNIQFDQFGNRFADPFKAGDAPDLPANEDGQEFSIMTYSRFVGDVHENRNEPEDINPLGQAEYPWSYMLNDIAALQYLYGANFAAGSNPGNTRYRFHETTGQMTTTDTVDGTEQTLASLNGKILLTLWDGNGFDTYDFTNYTNNMIVNLAPGAWSTFSTAQLTQLGTTILARGNLANAYQFNNDPRSLIEAAWGGSGNDVMIGNQVNNDLRGFNGNDVLSGKGGNDTMRGGIGDDTYVVEQSGDVVIELAGEGTDRVKASVSYVLTDHVEKLFLQGSNQIFGVGNALGNELHGNGANNTLNGRAGADMMFGGAGNDIYIMDNAGDRAFEAANNGIDTIQTAVSMNMNANIEKIVLLGNGNINAGGNSSDNFMTGNSGNNILYGGAGTDIMNGGAGNDTYHVDRASDQIIDAGGIDLVRSLISFTLSLNLENLILEGVEMLIGVGNVHANTIVGNGSNNVINARQGADRMFGGAGNDTYVVDNAGDIVGEAAGFGIDTVLTGVSRNLDANVERMTLLGTANLNAGGNSLSNVILGNSGANRINASSGNDTIKGDLGLDTLTGGAGNDTFVYSSTAESGPLNSQRDRITDFNGANSDKIHLASIDANTTVAGNQAFTLDTGGAFSAGEIRQTQFGANLLLEMNTDADSAAEMSILLLNSGLLDVGDFVL